ncbi:hypothetical protein ACCS78_39995, partial [Rhizobium johnstonii]
NTVQSSSRCFEPSRLLPDNVRDVDGEEDQRNGTVSVFDGVEPVIVIAPTAEEEAKAAATFLRILLEQGTSPNEIGIFCRSNDQIARASKIAELANVGTISSLTSRSSEEAVLIGTMHLAKFQPFR